MKKDTNKKKKKFSSKDTHAKDVQCDQHMQGQMNGVAQMLETELKRTKISKPENHDKFSTGFITHHYDPIWQLVQAVERNLINVSNFIIK